MKWLMAFCSMLLTAMVMLVVPTGCAESPLGDVPPRGGEAFASDRVARVIVVMKPELWDNLQSRAKSEKYYQCDFWYEDQLVSNVAVRAKGSSSLTFVVDDGGSRLSLKIDFNLLNDALTFRGLKKLNFHNGYRDPTLMRDAVAYELFREMGVPAPRIAFVDLWVNDTHLGVYHQVDQVDRTFLARHFDRNDGNLYKPIPPGSYLDWTKEDLDKQRAEMTATGSPDVEHISLGGGDLSEIRGALEPDETETEDPDESEGKRFDYIDYMRLKTNEKRADHSALMRLIDVLNNEPDETFPSEIEKVLDVDKALRFIAVETALVSLDSYLGRGVNYYLYEVDGKFTLIPWDLNESFGTYKCDLGLQDMIDFYIDEPTCGPVAERPLIDRLLAHPPYLDRYHSYLVELIEGPFSAEVMGSRIDETADLIRPYVHDDELKFHSTEEFERNLSEDVGRYLGLKRFVRDRGDSIRKQLAGELPSANNGNGNGGDPDKA